MPPQTTTSQDELNSALAEAIAANDVPETKRLLDAGADADARAPVNGHAPLFMAVAATKDPELVRLLAARSKDINIQDSCDFTPFTQAVRLNLPEIAGILLDHGASPFPSSPGRDYPLDWAIAHNLYTIIGRMLTLSGTPDRPFKSDDSLLLLAARTEDLALAKACLDAGAAANLGDKETGATALHIAARKGNAALITLLLERGGNVDAADSSAATPLDWARQTGSDAVITRILAERHMQETAREMTEGASQRIVIGLPLRLKKAPLAKDFAP